jgi:hypothetical protein
MARQSRSRRKHAAGETGKLIAAGALALVTFIAAAWGMHVWVTTPPPVQRDKATLCPVSTSPQDIIVILMDTTDGLPKPGKEEATKLLTDLIEQSPENALLDLRILDPAQLAGRQILALCNPGDGRGLSEINSNPEAVRREWRKRFRDPLTNALGGAFQTVRSETSPLLETFQAIALERFTGATAEPAHKRLVIVSDMLQNVPRVYTHYPPADLRYERFKTLPIYRKVRTDLHNAHVDIFYIDRDLKPPFNTGTHITFWLDWIADNHGQRGRVMKLQGAGKS